MLLAVPGQIWRDECYYLNRDMGNCERKYVLALAVDPVSGDVVTVVFTSKPNGLTEHPPCSPGPPRSGYHVSVPGGALILPTWADFGSLATLDSLDLQGHIRNGRKTLLTQTLHKTTFCAVLRCLLQMQAGDITMRQARLVGDSAAALACG